MGLLDSNRRGFLKGLVGAFGAVVGGKVLPTIVEQIEDVDPEKLLWEPGKKTIFLPEVPKVQEVVFDVVQPKIGDTLYIRKPHLFQTRVRHIKVTHGDGAVEVFRRQQMTDGGIHDERIHMTLGMRGIDPAHDPLSTTRPTKYYDIQRNDQLIWNDYLKRYERVGRH